MAIVVRIPEFKGQELRLRLSPTHRLKDAIHPSGKFEQINHRRRLSPERQLNPRSVWQTRARAVNFPGNQETLKGDNKADGNWLSLEKRSVSLSAVTTAKSALTCGARSVQPDPM
jgi:hypothetical protein